MNSFRTKLIVLLLLYTPLFLLIFFNLVPPSSTIETPSFLKEMFIVALILLLVFFAFLVILKIIPAKVAPYFTAGIIFSYIAFVLCLLYAASYRGPDFAGMLANFSLIPNSFLLKTLWIISGFTIFLLFLMRASKKSLAIIFLFTFGLSSVLVLAKELNFQSKTATFFGKYNEGNIVFTDSYTDNQNVYVFCLANRKFTKFPKDKYEKLLGQPLPWAAETFSPNSSFAAYEYSYDRDDLTKILVINKKTGQKFLLTAGENPIWIANKE